VGVRTPMSERNIMLKDSIDNTIDHEKEFGVYEGVGSRPDLADINVVLRAEFDTFNEAFAEAIRIFENELFEGERKLVLIMRGDEVVWDCSEGQTGDPEVIDMQVQLRH
jgi:hypothetical protein